MFAQEFFLHAYSLLCADRAHFLESAEGMTYVRVKHHDKVAGRILPLIRGPSGDLQKWQLKVRRKVRRIKNKQGTEADYLDLDDVTGMMVEEYKSQRGLYGRDLKKQFLRQMETNVAALDLDQFVDIVQTGILAPAGETEVAHPMMAYPGKMAQIRAFVYACTSGATNTNVFSDDEFLAGCARFSLENPVPSVSLRCALYGNSREITSVLAEAEKKYGKGSTKLDAKLYAPMNMGLPEKKERAKQGNIFSKFDEEKGSDDEDVVDAKRKPTVAVHETPRATLHAEALVSLKNMKMEHLRHLGIQDTNDPLVKSGHVMAGSVKFKLASIKRKYVEATELERAAAEKAAAIAPPLTV